MRKRLLKIVVWFFGTILSLMLIITLLLYIYKDEICGYAIKEINKHLKAKVTVSDVDLTFWSTFPNLSIDFNHTFIQDAYSNATANDTLLYTDQIRLQFNPIDIWYGDYHVKSIHVKPGKVKLKVNEKGEVNYDIFKESEDTTSSDFQLKLQEVVLEDMHFSYENRVTNQYYQTKLHDLNLSGDFSSKKTTITANSNLMIEAAQSGNVNLISNKPASFNIDVGIDNEKGIIEIPNATILIANLPFGIKGKVAPDSLNFEIHSKDVELADFANNFRVKQLDEINYFHGSGKIFFNLFMNGEVDTKKPVNIQCDFGIKNGSLIEPQNNLSLNNIFLEGEYSNVGGENQEFLSLSNLKFNTPGGPFQGKLKITEFVNPKIEGNANGLVNMGMVHALFKIPEVDKISGAVKVNSDFKLKVNYLDDASSALAIQKCDGNLSIRNIQLKLKADKRTFSNLNGDVYLRNEEAGIQKLSVKVGSSDILLNGVFKNIVPYFNKKGDLNAQVEVNSRVINIEDLGTTSKAEKIMDGRKFVLPNNIRGTVSMNVGDINYEGHHFQDLSGNLQIKGRKYFFPNINLKNAQALVRGSVSIEENSEELFTITANVASDNIQFKPLFKEWNSFQQDVIKAENIYGNAQANVYFQAPFDWRNGIVSNSIKSKVYMKISNGRLKDVEAFKSITQSLQSSNTVRLIIGKENIAGFEKKLLDLKFETLENNFTIQNGKLEIPAMMIHSSAMDINVSGTHTFDNIIDYRFGFRLRDIKNQEQNAYGTVVDDGTGIQLYMRMYGNMDYPTIVWDKQSKREQLKQDLQEEKETFKSIMKTEFGLFKNDSTVEIYQEKKGPKEILTIDFGDEQNKTPKQTAPKKDSKIKNKLQQWKTEAEGDNKKNIKFN